MFIDIGDVLTGLDPGGFRTSLDFADALLEESRVAVTPGEAFDAPGFIRISYATSIENLREGSTRLLEFVRAHATQAAAAR
jgi:aspartate aminotransferase